MEAKDMRGNEESDIDWSEPGAILRLGPNGRLTEEQLEANIKAACKARGDDSLMNPTYVWGMSDLDKEFKAQSDRWEKAIASVDVEEERRLYAEEEAREQRRLKRKKGAQGRHRKGGRNG